MAAAVTATERDASTEETPELKPLLAKMRAAHDAHGTPPLEERMGHLTRLGRAVRKKKAVIADAIAKDFGNRSRHETLLAEVWTTLQGIDHTQKNLASWMEPSERDVSWTSIPGTAEVMYQPLGVIGIISPWNYPLLLALSPLTGVLAAGNRAILKPSELTPETSRVLQELIAETFEPDHVRVILGGADVGETFAGLPLDHLVFTGSTRVGKMVMRAAAEHLTPLTLELGGKSPVIIGEEASIRTAARSIAQGKLLNAGQTCLAPDYVLVPEGKKDELVVELKAAIAEMYPTLANNPDYTSVVSEKHRARLEGYLADAKDKGATVLVVNPANEELDGALHKLAPTLVTGVTEEMVLMQEEIFGPILPIVPYKSRQHAIGYVNEHPRPLALYYFGHDDESVADVIQRTVSGGVSVNTTLMHIAQDDLPFGGVGPSGMGHYHGREGFEAFSKKKPIYYESRINTSAVRTPPFGRLLDSFLRIVLGK